MCGQIDGITFIKRIEFSGILNIIESHNSKVVGGKIVFTEFSNRWSYPTIIYMPYAFKDEAMKM